MAAPNHIFDGLYKSGRVTLETGQTLAKPHAQHAQDIRARRCERRAISLGPFCRVTTSKGSLPKKYPLCLVTYLPTPLCKTCPELCAHNIAAAKSIFSHRAARPLHETQHAGQHRFGSELPILYKSRLHLRKSFRADTDSNHSVQHRCQTRRRIEDETITTTKSE